MSEQLFYDEALHDMANETHCAVALAGPSLIELLDPRPEPADNPLWNASLGGADAVSAFLDRIAQDSGHEELRRAPLLFWGFSAAASFATTFASLHPERTMGFVRYHVRVRNVPVDLNRIAGLPALLIAGGGRSGIWG